MGNVTDQSGSIQESADKQPRRSRASIALACGLIVSLCLASVLGWMLRKATNEIVAMKAENAALIQHRDALQQQVEDLKPPKEGSLEGEIFIVTRGGQNYKLGLVEVGLFPADSLVNYLARRLSEASVEQARLQPGVDRAKAAMESKDKAASAAWDHFLKDPRKDPTDFKTHQKLQDESWKADRHYRDLARQLRYYSSGDYYFKDLPPAFRVVKTDSEGRFSIAVPTTGQFALVARAQRRVVDDTEKYFWIVRVSMNGGASARIFLSNDNLSSTGSPDSLIRTID